MSFKIRTDASGNGQFTIDSTDVLSINTNNTVSLPTGTANGIAYLNGSKVLTSGSALTFDGSNLGIGTASPSQSWTGGSARVAQLQGGYSQITVLRVNESGGAYGDLQLVSAASAEVGIHNFANGAMRFGTNGTDRMRLDASGNLLVGKTSATANGGDIQVSKGIAFPATQVACSDANTLDDYEEGTWTPVISVNSGSPTFTYNSRGGQYVKIGRFVWAYFYMDVNVTSAAGSLVGITTASLPFPPASVSNSIYTSGGFVTHVPSSITGVTVLLANNANFASSELSYFQNTTSSASYTFVTGVYAGYLVYESNS